MKSALGEFPQLRKHAVRRRQTVFIGLTPALRLRIETTIENLLALLDEIDSDENLEPDSDDEDGVDAEPDGDGEVIMWPEGLESQEVLATI